MGPEIREKTIGEFPSGWGLGLPDETKDTSMEYRTGS